MKRTLYFLALFFCISSFSMAQTFNSAIECDVAASLSNNHVSIVRTWNDDYALSYHTDGSKSLFILTNISDFLAPYYSGGPIIDEYYSDPLPPDVRINDIQIVDNYAFFCGYDNNCGIVGFIKLPDLFTGAFSFNYHHLTDMTELNRMVAYKIGSTYKVVALGTYIIPPTYTNHHAIEIDNPQNTFSINYYHRAFYAAGSDVEHINDIVLTDNTVTFVGAITSYANGNYLSFRTSTNLSSVIGDPSFEDIHVATSPFEVNGIHPKAVHMSLDTIAVTYENNQGNNSYSRLRVIDVLSANNAFSQQTKALKDDPTAVVYSDRTDRLVLLEPLMSIPSGVSQFSFWEPHRLSSYVAPVTYLPEKYYSIDLFSENNFVSTDGNLWYLQKVSPVSGLGCPPSTSIEIINITPLTFNRYTVTNTVMGLLTSPLSTSQTTSFNKLLLKCNE